MIHQQRKVKIGEKTPVGMVNFDSVFIGKLLINYV